MLAIVLVKRLEVEKTYPTLISAVLTLNPQRRLLQKKKKKKLQQNRANKKAPAKTEPIKKKLQQTRANAKKQKQKKIRNVLSPPRSLFFASQDFLSV